jgi:hypothetical protein
LLLSTLQAWNHYRGLAVCVEPTQNRRGTMRHRWKVGVLVMAAAAMTPAAAQQNDTGIPTETQERLARGGGEIPWLDLIGLVGLLGLLGLRRRHPEDSYRPSPIE